MPRAGSEEARVGEDILEEDLFDGVEDVLDVGRVRRRRHEVINSLLTAIQFLRQKQKHNEKTQRGR
jgi:hypothetical protein